MQNGSASDKGVNEGKKLSSKGFSPNEESDVKAEIGPRTPEG